MLFLLPFLYFSFFHVFERLIAPTETLTILILFVNAIDNPTDSEGGFFISCFR